MAGEEEEQEELTEEQRLERLERSMSRHDKLTLVLVLVLTITFGMVISSFVLMAMQPKPEVVEASDAAGTADLGGVDAKMAEFETLLAEQAEKITAFENDIAASASGGSAVQEKFVLIKELLLEREKAHQQALLEMKAGMRSLAYMIKGSRSWYEHNETKLDGFIRFSQQREEKINQLIVAPSTTE